MKTHIFVTLFLACSLMDVNAASIDSPLETNADIENNGLILKSVKEFLKIVDKLNLNVSIIGSQNGGIDIDNVDGISVFWHMPRNKVAVRKPTLDATTQNQYLDRIARVLKKEPSVGAKTRIIKVENGKEETTDEYYVNPEYVIELHTYDHIVKDGNGEANYKILLDDVYTMSNNYNFSEPTNDGVKSIQLAATNLMVKLVNVTEDFPNNVQKEIKKILPKLALQIGDLPLLARLLTIKLERELGGSYQVLVGSGEVAVGKRPYALFQVHDIYLFVFI